MARLSFDLAGSPSLDLRAMAEAVPHVAWISDAEGSGEYLNRRGCDYTGVNAGATGGWSWLSLLHPVSAEVAQGAWLDAVRRQSLFEIECRMRRAGGGFEWHSVRSLPLRDRDGRVLRWVGTAIEIEDRKRAEARLRRADQDALALEALQAVAPVGLGFVDRGFRWTRVNETLASINGVPAEEHAGRTVGELMPSTWARAAAMCRHALETGDPVRGQRITEPGATGESRTWLASCHPVRADAEVVGVAVVVVDVTAERREEESFRSAVMANMADGLFTTDGEGRFTFVNAAAERMLGRHWQELRGRPVAAMIGFDLPQRTPRSGKGGTMRVAGAGFRRSDGSVLRVAYSATPLAGPAEPGGLVVVFSHAADTTSDGAHVLDAGARGERAPPPDGGTEAA